MKKLLSILMLVCLTLSLFAGCAQKPQEPADPKNPVVDPTEPTDPTEPAEPSEPTEPDVPEEPSEPDPDAVYDVDGKLFLYANPIVAVRDGEYEIIIDAMNEGNNYIVIDGKVYRAEDTIDDSFNIYKIRVKQSALDTAKTYAVCYKGEGDEVAHGKEFTFRPLEKEEGINVIVLSDIHTEYRAAKTELKYFGDDLDLIVFNGDIESSLNSADQTIKIQRFFAEVSKGQIPVLFARGNHEYLGEGWIYYNDYLSDNGKSYYKFSMGAIEGLIIDAEPLGIFGSDSVTEKGDNLDMIREENAFLNGVTLDNGKINFVVSHIDPNTYNAWDGLYDEMCARINDLKIDFFIAGHEHLNFITEPNSPVSLQPHDYTIINGCMASETEKHSCIALTLFKDKVSVTFVDSKLNVMDSAEITYPNY